MKDKLNSDAPVVKEFINLKIVSIEGDLKTTIGMGKVNKEKKMVITIRECFSMAKRHLEL